MSDTYKVRIGVEAARELELEVDDPDGIGTSFEKAIETGEPVLWITDSKGHRFGVRVASIAFIEFERPEQRGVGFGLG
jgi:hypothetical protein